MGIAVAPGDHQLAPWVVAVGIVTEGEAVVRINEEEAPTRRRHPVELEHRPAALPFREGDVGTGLRSTVLALDHLSDGEPDPKFAARVNFAAWLPLLQRVRITPRHDTAVTAAAFAPDGRSLLTVN